MTKTKKTSRMIAANTVKNNLLTRPKNGFYQFSQALKDYLRG